MSPPAVSAAAAETFGVSLAPPPPPPPFAVRRNYCRARSPFAVRRSHAGKPCEALRRSPPKIEASKGLQAAAVRVIPRRSASSVICYTNKQNLTKPPPFIKKYYVKPAKFFRKCFLYRIYTYICVPIKTNQ